MTFKRNMKYIYEYWRSLPSWVQVFTVVFFILIIGLVVNNPSSNRTLLSSNPESSDATKIIGEWYDDVGSPDFLDATFTIFKRSDKYLLHRKNGDGSAGTYLLGLDGKKFVKINDKHGAYYVIEGTKLHIFDSRGFVRSAVAK
ncbi:hypothetical protein QFX18_01415 [Saccharophagus degradans]|uniref:hypothetical protein n=1 Tax=Saccharophagus degradans TaxID=86304 RepID=UPI002477CF7B|nr:hypothetical protein [Saccharophagus degradans]WGO98719.1 hypothetical protein QFX18_01415 [Saccharophagus degradans]